ncbi:methyltransferase family protein [Mycobacterium hubeiense]|uniref:methyltransferase family protein n=1 Tax=Mycobacterium hubeiense TaxID=1867256 RepID=UPI000C7ED405|nr:isoprenylcysteine carboxylmethyltransferase family protein [Mycobacterium sp. QGD 101]
MDTSTKATVTSLLGLVYFGVVLFLPAGTFNYWQAWLFIAVFTAMTGGHTIYWALRRPEVLRRRMNAGPMAETRPAQKIIVIAVYLCSSAMFVVSALDHRFGWSDVPIPVVLFGDVLVAIALGIGMLVVQQNNYAAANITVEPDQCLVSTGLYGFVRHPMYFGALIMMIGVPLALDSYWGLFLIIPSAIVLGFRIVDEEKALEQELSGYHEYTQQVRHRLVPGVW